MLLTPPCWNNYRKGGIIIDSTTLNFLKELYEGYKKFGEKFTLQYSKDPNEKLKQINMLNILEESGFITLTSSSLGWRGIEFTSYGISYIEDLI